MRRQCRGSAAALAAVLTLLFASPRSTLGQAASPPPALQQPQPAPTATAAPVQPSPEPPLLAPAVESAAQPAAAAAGALSPQLAAAAQCPVSVQYSVNLGQGQDFATVPIFVATVNVMNNDPNVSVGAWRMGWQFPYGAVIRSKQDVFDPGVDLLNPDSNTPVVQAAGNGSGGAGGAPRAIAPGQQLQFGFLGTKGTGALSPANPFNVGAITGVAFNNLLCALTTAPPPAAPPPPAPSSSASTAVANPTQLQIDYQPIEYVNSSDPGVLTRTQFLARVFNIQNASTIDLADVSFQYWFAAPEGGLPLSVELAPWDYWEAKCEWATPPLGCAGVTLGISPGFRNSPGAQFALNVSFAPAAGALVPTGEGAAPILNLGKGLDVIDLLLTITTKAGVAQLNATNDYSFLDTPRPDAPLDPSATIVPRRALPNPKLPAYLKGALVWGALPNPEGGAPAAAGLGRAAGPAGAGVGATAANGAASNQTLPAGVSCESVRSGAQQSCSLVAVYCCTAADPAAPEVSAGIPLQWPPVPLNVPAPEGGVVAVGEPGAEAVTQVAQFPPLPPPPPSAVQGSPAGSDASSQGGGGSAAWAAGLGVGLAAAAAAAVGGFLFWRKRRRRQAAAAEKEPSNGRNEDSLVLPWVNTRAPLAASPAGSRHALLPGSRVRSTSASAASTPMAYAYANGGPSSPGGRPQGLYKYGSGISGTSSGGPDPVGVLDTFDSAGQMPTLPTAAALALREQHRLAAVAEAGRSREEEARGPGLPDNVMQLLERKARSSPALFAGMGRARASDTAVSGAGKGTGAARPSGEFSDASGGDVSPRSRDGSFEDQQPTVWQLQRAASWDGVMQHQPGQDSWERVAFIKRRRAAAAQQLPGPLPPLHQLPPPLLPGAQAPPDVDLDVDWAELEGKLGRCLGTGGFGSVYEAEWRGRRVAVKMLPPFTAQDGNHNLNGEGDSGGRHGVAAYEALLREIQLASKFQCDRLVKVYGACTRDRARCCLIMELMEGGNLFQRIYDRTRRRLGYLDILQLANDMAAGLAYLHPSVVHRDLKPQNVLLDREGRAKLADFGISRVKDPTKSYLTQVTAENGTPQYMAPELMNGTRVDEKVDVYALGVILNEAWARRQPWRDSAHFFQIILKVAINGERPWLDPDAPEPLRRLITKCWHPDPHVRPSCAEIMRLTDIMMQEELRRWEALTPQRSAGSGSGGSAAGVERGASFNAGPPAAAAPLRPSGWAAPVGLVA